MGLDFKLRFNLRIQFWCSSLFVWALKEVLQWKSSHHWYLIQIQVIITILRIIKTTCLLFRVWRTKDRIYDILSYFPIQSQTAWWSCTQKKFYNTYNKIISDQYLSLWISAVFLQIIYYLKKINNTWMIVINNKLLSLNFPIRSQVPEVYFVCFN